LFEVESEYLLPELDPEEQVGTALRRLLAREHAGGTRRRQMQFFAWRIVPRGGV